MIKKNLHDHGYKYYFNKEEYEDSRFSEPKSYKGGAFRNNRTLIITLLDIAVIVLIILVVIPFVRKSYEIPDFNGYSLELTDYKSENKIFLSLAIYNKDKGESKVADLVDIEFYLENSKEHIFVNDLLPLPGKSLFYRIHFAYDGSDIASSKVTIKGTSAVLNVKLDKN